MSTQPQIIPPQRDRSGRRALLIWGTVLVLSGSGIGAGSALLFEKPPPPPVVQPKGEPEPGVPNFSPAPIVSQMSHELSLTSEQTEQVTAAYTQSLSAIRALRADMIVKLNAEHEKLRAAMKKTLTDQQFAEWDRHFEAVRTRFMPDAPPWRDFHHHEHGGMYGDRPGPGGPERWMGEHGGMNGIPPGAPVGPDDRPEPSPRLAPPGPGSRFDQNEGPPPPEAPGGQPQPQRDQARPDPQGGPDAPDADQPPPSNP